MKQLRFLTLVGLTACLALALFAPPPARATDTSLSYTTPIQTSDTPLVIEHKQAVAQVNGNSYANITTATTTTVKSGAGVLDKIVVNSAGSGSTITIYDNTAGSGTKIGTATGAAQTTLTYNVHFSTGLTIVTASGSAADITVSYR